MTLALAVLAPLAAAQAPNGTAPDTTAPTAEEKRNEDIVATFPDYHKEIVALVAKGDAVVVRCKVSGTHRGVGRLPLNGGLLVGVAPTQKRFEVQHIHWYKLRDGKIVEHTANRDDLGMMRQLGLLTAPAPAR